MRRLSHCALNLPALTNTITIQAASQRGWEPRAPCGARSDPRTGRECNQGTGKPFTINTSNLRELRRKGKMYEKLFKTHPLVQFGDGGFPLPRIILHKYCLGNHCTPESQRGTRWDERE